MAEFYTVLTNFIGTLDGRECEYHAGEVVESSDPALKQWPNFFGPLVISHRSARGIEQATAGPGEKRGAKNG
jgi:hypothetical protein